MSTNGNGAAMAVREADSSALAMVMEPSEALQRLRELQDFVATVMHKGEDFGVLPGTKARDGEPPKMILLKPGAEKLAEIYGFAIRYVDERAPIERWGDDGTEPLFAYFKRAEIVRRRDGMFLGSGVGSCNSREKKYAARWVFEREVPPDVDRSRLQRKEGIGKGGKPYTLFKVPNPEIFDLVNTIEKMACKRALVGAVIAVTRSSGLFTQDMEDREHASEEQSKRGAPVADDAEYEEAPADPPPLSPFASALARIANEGGSAPDDIALLLGSDLPKVRALAWARAIDTCPPSEIAAVEGQIRERETHERVRADMLRKAEKRRGALSDIGPTLVRPSEQ